MNGAVTIDMLVWAIAVLAGIDGVLLTLSIKRATVLFKLLGEVQRDFSNFRVEVAKNYVTNGYLKETKDEMLDHMKSIEDKLDKILLKGGAAE